MYNYFTAIHRVPAAVLGIAAYDNPRAIHECTKVIPWSAKYLNLHWLVQVSANISLPMDAMELYLLNTI